MSIQEPFPPSVFFLFERKPQRPQSLVMRATLRLLANPTSAGSTKGFKPAPLALLPPIPLYRRLLRGHRKYLDPEMRLLGDEYIKSEFRAHRNVENPMHIVRLICTAIGSSNIPAKCLRNPFADWILDGMADVRSKD